MKRSLAAAALILATVIAACAPTTSSGPSPTAGNQPKKGGTLILARAGEVTNLDPHKVPAFTSARVFELVYSYLMRLDENLGVQPDLAASMPTSSADGKTVTVKIRSGVQNNGTITALEIDVLLGIFAAGAADLDRRHASLPGTELVIDFDFNGQTVAIPSGDVGRIETGHGFRLDDEVLQNFVEGRAQVNAPVGVGRPIVQNVGGLARARLANAAIEVVPLPAREDFGLGLRKVGLHGESGFGQIDGLLKV